MKIQGGNIAWKNNVHGRARHLTSQTKQFLGRIGIYFIFYFILFFLFFIFFTQELFLRFSDQSIYNIATESVNLTVNFKTALMPLSLDTSTLLLGLLYLQGRPKRGHAVSHPPRDKRRMFVQKFTETRIVSTGCVSGARDSRKRWQNFGLKVISVQSSHISWSHFFCRLPWLSETQRERNHKVIWNVFVRNAKLLNAHIPVGDAPV